MVLPYNKGFDNKEAFLSISLLLFLGLFPLSYISRLELQHQF